MNKTRDKINKKVYSQTCDICGKNEGLNTRAVAIHGHMISTIQPLAYSLCQEHYNKALDIIYNNEQIFFNSVKNQIETLGEQRAGITIILKEKRYFKNFLLNWAYKILVRLRIKDMDFCWECPKCKKIHAYFTDPCDCGWKHIIMYKQNKNAKKSTFE